MQPIPHHVLVILDFEVLEVFGLEQFGVQLLADDLRPHEVLFAQDQAHLVQDVLGLLPALHRPERLDLHLLEQVRCLLELAFVLFDLRQHPRQTSPFDLHEDLPIRDVAQRADELQHARLLESREPAHDQLDHVRDRALRLAALLRQHHDVLLQLGPLLHIVQDLADLAQEPRCGDAIGGLPGLLLQGEHLFNRLHNSAGLFHGVDAGDDLLHVLAIVLGRLRILRQVPEHGVQVLGHGWRRRGEGRLSPPTQAGRIVWRAPRAPPAARGRRWAGLEPPFT
mmetsp:Transcript_22541/g.67639  ORF Transcript_22541/g.67639 Transcript_22541/m.67639 type:complete len:281 (-) Transcript_22541:2-844(-)